MKKYQFVTATGHPCCTSDNINRLCESCRAAADAMNEDYAPPNVYRSLMAPRIEIELDAHGVPRPYARGIREHQKGAK
jgi:hypothetical protein